MILKIFTWHFKRKGWKIVGTGISSDVKKCIVIAMPHTSNWDFVYSMAAIKLFGMKVNYLAKKELFQWPIKNIFLSTGGIPVERSKNSRMVEAMVDMFNKTDRLILTIPAEGTRKRVEKIKSGFYRVALATGEPISMAYLDYSRKEAGFSKPFYPTGDGDADALVIRNYYKDKKGKCPENFNLDAIRLD